MPSEDPLPPLHPPRLLEVHEVALELKCSPETVLRLIRRGELAGVRLTPRSWRVRRAALDAFIAAREQGHNGNGNGAGG